MSLLAKKYVFITFFRCSTIFDMNTLLMFLQVRVRPKVSYTTRYALDCPGIERRRTGWRFQTG
jgi:hypothetical protein